jgi:hypothetical protein
MTQPPTVALQKSPVGTTNISAFSVSAISDMSEGWTAPLDGPRVTGPQRRTKMLSSRTTSNAREIAE